MATIGTLCVYLILLLATWSAALALVGARRRSSAMVQSAQLALYGVAASATLAVLLLAYAFTISDYSLIYVQQHSERAMPVFYRITALWGGMEGSLLLWVWLLALVSAVAMRTNQHRLGDIVPYASAVLMLVVVFFGVVMVVSSNPFDAYLSVTPETGKGLNPLLQNPYMVTHPPSLYLGFVTLTVPFAFAMGSMLAGRVDETWLHAARPWALVSWFALALGLTLGMLWAYEELGWGGYWGWDPVENAGFMPWLLCTAFLHSIMVQDRRQMLKVWNVVLALLAFVMTIFGTFLTRSGFIDSVHAFARSNIGYVFLGFIALTLVVGFGVILWRRPLLRSRGALESALSREFWFLLNNWVLLSACLLVMVLTIFPGISELFGDKITISIPAFNRWMVPIGVALLVLTGVGPMLGWRHSTAAGLRRQFQWPTVVGLLVGVGLGLWGPAAGAVALLTWALCAFVIATVLQEPLRAASVRARAAQTGFGQALGGLLLRNHRRYGGYVVHIGVALMCVGFAGESLKQEKEAVLRPGERLTIGRYELRYDGLRITEDDLKGMLTAGLTVFEDGKPTGTIHPARWVYFRHEDSPTTEVAIQRSTGEDLFVALGGHDQASGSATFKVVINPLVTFVWLGFVVMALGAAIAGLPLSALARPARPIPALARAEPTARGSRTDAAAAANDDANAP